MLLKYSLDHQSFGVKAIYGSGLKWTIWQLGNGILFKN